MKKLWNTVLKGLATLLPVGITLYIIVWLGRTAESLMGGLIRQILPEPYYWPGLGVLAGLLLLIVVGLLVNAWVVRRLVDFGGSLLERIPLVNTLYGAIRDFTRYFSTTDETKALNKVVMITLGETRLIGFLTRESMPDIGVDAGGEDVVAVYLPMSYQIGGYTLYVERKKVQSVDLSVEEAMRLVLTAGVSSRARPARGGEIEKDEAGG